MAHNAISLFSPNQVKPYNLTKSEEVSPLSRQIKLLGDLIEEFSGKGRVGEQKRPSAVCSTFGSHSRGGELITELKCGVIEMSFGRDMYDSTLLER